MPMHSRTPCGSMTDSRRTVSDRWFVLPLNPEPWKVGQPYVIRSGGLRAAIGPNAELQAYQEAVREEIAAILALGDAEESVLLYPKGTKIKLTCYFWRQRAEYVTPQARTHRKHEIDATNALKAIEDAFQKLIYNNDKDNLEVRSVMVTQDVAVDKPKIVVHIEEYTGFDPNEIPKHVWEAMDRVS